jgi:hypothetical protein
MILIIREEQEEMVGCRLCANVPQRIKLLDTLRSAFFSINESRCAQHKQCNLKGVRLPQAGTNHTVRAMYEASFAFSQVSVRIIIAIRGLLIRIWNLCLWISLSAFLQFVTQIGSGIVSKQTLILILIRTARFFS